MSQVPAKTLPSGDELPMVGLGTYKLTGAAGKESMRTAIDAGYTHLDTAEGYGNEAEVGDVLAEYDRDELFVTSKVLDTHLHYESVLEACRDSLDRLGTDYLDLYLIHWPNPAISLRESLDAMARLHEEGLVRNVGVSNFSAYQLSCAHHLSDVPIAVNQIEFHPLFQRPDIVEYCRESDTIVEAAAPLARTKVLDEPAIEDLAEEYDRSPAQIALKWAFERDVVVIPKSGSPENIRDNFELFDWELPEADLRTLDDLDRDEPVYDHPARDWSGMP